VKKKRPASTRKKRRARPPARRRTNRKRSRQIATPQGQALRWNPDPEDVQRSVIKLVLSLVEFIRKLMERQAIRRLEERTLTPEEIENVGVALMKLEETVRLLAKRFNLSPHDLNLDLGPVGRLH
jgi:gas vesicle protein GvpK